MEQQHKKTGEREMKLVITTKREEMKDLVEQETRTAYNRIKKERYQWGNKTGKYLAKLLKKKTTVNYLEEIQTSTGAMVHTTAEIARTFQDYYGKLYSINQQDKIGTIKVKTKAFLDEVSLNKIPEEKFCILEAPITEDEIKSILKDSPGGKSSGPDGLMTFYYKKFKDILVPKLCSYMNRIGTQPLSQKKVKMLHCALVIGPSHCLTQIRSYLRKYSQGD